MNKSIQVQYLVDDWIYKRMLAVVEHDECVLSISDFTRQAIKLNLEKKYGIEIIDLIPFEQRASLTQTDVVLEMLSHSQEVFNVTELRKLLIKPAGETRKLRRKDNESIRKMLRRMIDKNIVEKQGMIEVPQISSNQVGEFSVKTRYVIYSLSSYFLGATSKFKDLTRIILKTLLEKPQKLHSIANLKFKAEIKREFFSTYEYKNILNSLHDQDLLKQIKVSSNTYFASTRYAEPENKNGSMMISVRISIRLADLLSDLGILSSFQSKRLFLLESIKLLLHKFPDEYYQELRPTVVNVMFEEEVYN